ncbi:MAG: penicillin-binding protein 1A [Gammaproteobacteria bacterium]
MLRIAFYCLFALVLAAAATIGGIVVYFGPTLPSIDTLKDVRLQVPLRIYSADGQLLGEFGEQRRKPVSLEQVPPRLIHALLDTEDQRFYRHHGIDPQAVLRAVVALVRTGEKTQGASTITMQVAREYFLSREKKYSRKVREMLLALKIERELDKGQILQLYMNTVFLGQRAYGFAAAAQVYYGKELDELTLPEMAMLAGLPQRPSRLNPIADPQASLARREYVLRRMAKHKHITAQEFAAAVDAPETATLHGQVVDLDAPWVGEMARAEIVARYGEEAYTGGLKAYTTIDSRLQIAANTALRNAALAYDRRHGWRGAERKVALPAGAGEDQWRTALAGSRELQTLVPALVTAIDDQGADLYTLSQGPVRLGMEGIAGLAPYISVTHRGAPARKPGDLIAVGDIVRLQPVPAADGQPAGGWRLAQIPEVEGALVALDPSTGAVRALVGGFDFSRSKFNRVTQALRQPGSNFKPFVYSAALDAGYTPASFINDAPIVFDTPGLDNAWRPENFTGRYYGPTRLREALAHSRNLVSIRLLRAIGIKAGIERAAQCGFPAGRLPHNLSLALGSGESTPMEVVRGYAVFANGGFLVTPHVVERIETDRGQVLWKNRPKVACRGCERPLQEEAATEAEPENIEELQARAAPPAAGTLAQRAISAENAWLMTSMLRDVIRVGTGRRALALGRDDLAGKTGTTNEQRDAWFSGFNADMVATAWLGFDQLQSLGRDETGGRAALPMWMDFMRVALEGTPPAILEQPQGLVTVRINPATGALAGAGDARVIYETFRADNVPRGGGGEAPTGPGGAAPVFDQLF